MAKIENSDFFSCESDSRIANVRLSVRQSVRQSVTKTPQPLRIKPICHYAYLLISQTPISHHANQPIIPSSHNYAYWLLDLLAICSSFATSKPFRLFMVSVAACGKTSQVCDPMQFGALQQQELLISHFYNHTNVMYENSLRLLYNEFVVTKLEIICIFT